MVAYFPIKTSAKHYYLTVGAQGQVKLAKKSSTYNVTHKKPAPPTKKLFSSANYKTCRVFWHFNQVRNPYRSGYSRAKPRAIQLFFCEPLELTGMSKC